MAYQARRQEFITEDIELINHDSEVEKVVHVEVNLEAIARDFNRCKNELIRAQLAIKKVQTEEAYEVFGEAVISLFKVIFGEANTAVMLDFYENNYLEMAQEIMPFITDTIAPAINAAADERKVQLAERYKLTKAQRKKLGI